MELLLLIVGLVVGALVGWLAARLAVARARGARPATPDPAVVAERHRAELAEARHAGETAAHGLEVRLADAGGRVRQLEQQVAEWAERHRSLRDGQAAEAEQRRRREAEETRVLTAIAPMQQQLSSMQATVAGLEQQRSLQHGELAEQLRAALRSEERLAATADTLASALRSNSTRGVWGETQLRNVVEAAGLLRHVDFALQQGVETDAGAGRPDMVVHLPGGKHIAVDAKVPFSAYLEAAAIPATATPVELARRDQLLAAHRRAVREHVTALGSKAYWEGIAASPELVVAFIPSESLISSALEVDPGLLDWAFSKRVALASPVTLWSVLKTVAFSWQQDVVTDEAKALFDRSRELHGRLVAMAGHVDKLGRSIERGVKDYNLFVGSLERQVLPSARRLVTLDGEKLLGAPREIDEQRRALSASELLGELEAAAPPAPRALDDRGAA